MELRRLTFVLIIALALCMLIYQSFLYFENKDTVVSTTKQMQPGLPVLDVVSFSWTLPIEAGDFQVDIFFFWVSGKPPSVAS